MEFGVKLPTGNPAARDLLREVHDKLECPVHVLDDHTHMSSDQEAIGDFLTPRSVFDRVAAPSEAVLHDEV